jgi:hypothetical protein
MTGNAMTYKLNEKAKAFSYTREELFDCITRVVAHPHGVITDHDKARTMAIFLIFGDYLGNYTEGQEDQGHYICESDATDFEGYVMEMLNEENYGKLKAEEILK